MKISVVCSTYNQPAWLEKVLTGYRFQTDRDFELLIADDGSGIETAELIRDCARRSAVPIRHVWHEDRGYRRAVVLNHAVVAAEGDYVIFTDGDCIPRADFVATHRRLATPGRFLSGGALYLNRVASDAITDDDIATGRFARSGWLRRAGFAPGHRGLRLTRSRWRARLYDRLTPTKATFNLGNASVAREAVLRANGFEAEMQYGGMDRAFGGLLENMGIHGLQVRHRAVLVHLDHGRPYKRDRDIHRNHEIRDRIAERGETRSHHGIAELEGSPSSPPTRNGDADRTADAEAPS